MKKFWIGDVPLSVAYWVYGWLLPMGLALAFVILGITLVPGSVPARLFLLGLCCYIVFWGVGTWRAATKYQGLKVWAVLAKVHIVAPLAVLVLAFTTLALVEQQRGSVAGSANEQTDPAIGQSEGHALAKQHVKSQCRTTMAEARAKIPELHGLDDASAIRVLQRTYYPEMTVEQISILVCGDKNASSELPTSGDLAAKLNESPVRSPSAGASATQPQATTPAKPEVETAITGTHPVIENADSVHGERTNAERESRSQGEPSRETHTMASKKKIPSPLTSFDDLEAAGIGSVYRPKSYTEPEEERQPAPKALGWLDQRRYESCQQDAAKAPTPQGVVVGLRICREKFGQ